MQPQASLLVSLGIPALALLVLVLVALAVRHVTPGEPHARNVALAAVAWLSVSGLLAASGLLARFELRPPPVLLVIVPTFVLPFALGLSTLGARIAEGVPLAWLVGFHAFRLPLELVMHAAAREGTMPEQMTFTGHSFDIVTGASALVVATLIARGHASRALVIAWNALGTLLLAVIVVIAVASLPLFHAYGAEPAHLNTWVAYFPFVWLPAALVAAALLGHVVLWRRLLAHGRIVSPTTQPSPFLREI